VFFNALPRDSVYLRSKNVDFLSSGIELKLEAFNYSQQQRR